MRSRLSAILISALLTGAGAGGAVAQRGGQSIDLSDTGPAQPVAPLPVEARQLRLRQLVGNPNAQVPPTTMTYSVNRRPPGGHFLVFHSYRIATRFDSVGFSDTAAGSFVMELPSGSQGRYFFDCAFTGASQVEWAAGPTLTQAGDVVPITSGHALFVLDLQPNWRIMVKPIGIASGTPAYFKQCEIARLN